MDFTVSHDDFAGAVTRAANGLANPKLDLIRSAMLIRPEGGRVLFASSDGSVTIKSWVHAEADGGQVTVPGRLFADLARNLPSGDVTIATTDTAMTLKCRRSTFKLPLLIAEYPELPAPAARLGTVKDGEVFASAIRKVLPATATERSGYVQLMSVVLHPSGEVLTLAASDKYRLAVHACAWQPDQDESCPEGLIPAMAADQFYGASGEITLGWDDRMVTLETAAFEVTVRKIADKWPGTMWKLGETPQPFSIEVDARDLAGILKRARLASTEPYAVRLTFSTGSLRVQGGSNIIVDEVLEIPYDGEEYSGIFGIDHLLDGVSGCDDTCQIEFGTGNEYGVRTIHIASGDFRYTCAPRHEH